MSTSWFREYVFHAAIDSRFLPARVLDLLGGEPRLLPEWDPMSGVGCQQRRRPSAEDDERPRASKRASDEPPPRTLLHEPA